jgi:hypothetical protein
VVPTEGLTDNSSPPPPPPPPPTTTTILTGNISHLKHSQGKNLDTTENRKEIRTNRGRSQVINVQTAFKKTQQFRLKSYFGYDS